MDGRRNWSALMRTEGTKVRGGGMKSQKPGPGKGC